jgi:perosamine synthetase
MYISSKPSCNFRSILSKGRNGSIDVFPFDQKRCIYFYTARYALAAGVQALNLNQDENILIPAYNCWVEIDPIKHQGLQVKYYKVRKDLMIDLAAMEATIDEKTKAVLITHYLGFPQPIDQIREICKKHNIFLIEDCAHAFLSDYNDSPLGSFGDLSIFSFRKTLPIPDGGALVINNKNIDFTFELISPNSFPSLYVFAELLRYRTFNNGLMREAPSKALGASIHGALYFARSFLRLLHKIQANNGVNLVYPSGNVFRKEIKNWGMSSLSRRIMNSTDFGEVKRIRRNNFKYLLNRFHNDERVILPLKELPEGICPLFFPVLIEKRDLIYKILKKRGVSGHDWWGDFHPDVSWGNFSEAKYLKTHIFGFPVHQDLTLSHIERMLQQFEEVFTPGFLS